MPLYDPYDTDPWYKHWAAWLVVSIAVVLGAVFVVAPAIGWALDNKDYEARKAEARQTVAAHWESAGMTEVSTEVRADNTKRTVGKMGHCDIVVDGHSESVVVTVSTPRGAEWGISQVSTFSPDTGSDPNGDAYRYVQTLPEALKQYCDR